MLDVSSAEPPLVGLCVPPPEFANMTPSIPEKVMETAGPMLPQKVEMLVNLQSSPKTNQEITVVSIRVLS